MIFKTNLMTEESDGIKRLFDILCPLVDILQSGKVLRIFNHVILVKSRGTHRDRRVLWDFFFL